MIQFTNNFGKSFILGPAPIRFLKLRRVFENAKDLVSLSDEIRWQATSHISPKEEIKNRLLMFSQFLLDSDSVTAMDI